MFNNLFKRNKKDDIKSNRWIFGTMLAFGITGLISAFVLTVEKFHVIENPNATLSCSFNIVLNCATVMQTWQASVFGFPNSLIGLMAYPVVIAVAIFGLAGVKFPRWVLIGANIGYLLGAVFAYWLFFQSVYVIQVLCPWCLIVTFSTTLLLATITHYNLRHNTFNLKGDVHNRIKQILANDFDKLAVAVWIVALIALVFLKFGDSLFL
ncbi:MAG: vitamin K epoxide reductase family protein [Chloroflexi bacterium]|nr:MAG: vitamin K epoxide reductase family protein [Chloroflexota bacterium]